MESDGTTILGEWSSSSSSFNGEMYSINTEEADFMAQLLGKCSIPVPNESLLPHVISSPSSNNLGFCYWPNIFNTQQDSPAEPPPVYPYPYPCSSDHHENTASFFPVSYDYPHPILTRIDNENSSVSCYLADDDDVKTTTMSNNSSMEFEVDANADAGDEYLMNPDDSMESAGDGKIEIPIPETSLEDNLSETSSKKRPLRIPIDHVVVKNKRTVKTKKNQRSEIKDGGSEKHTVVFNRQQSSNCLSEDESINVSQELKASSSSSSALNLNGKTRASRGSATDPQSLYARKRRERINERLRILQNLVPNGTKVDISTMLEEAVQYVKFLQLQIKLLSSDDLWMYAPLAYNGMNIGLDLKIGATLNSSSSS